MSVPWRTDLSWLTVEVRAFIDLLWLGQKHHLAMCNASQPPAASKLPPARRGISHCEKDKPEDKLHHLFFFLFYRASTRASLRCISPVHFRRLRTWQKCSDRLLWQVLPCSHGATSQWVCCVEVSRNTQLLCPGSAHPDVSETLQLLPKTWLGS